MAVTHAITLQIAEDGTRMVLGTITMDSSYASGGETVTPASLGLQTINGAILSADANATPAAAVPVWDQTNQKILVFQETGNAGLLGESSGDLSAFTFTGLFFGT